MIVVKLQNGLGNQIFMYAHGRALALSTNTTLALEISYFLSKNKKPYHEKFWIDKFNICYDKIIFDDYVKNRKNLQDIIPFFQESQRLSNIPKLNLSKPPSHMFLFGWWQNESYFKHIREILLKELTLKNPIIDVNLNKIKSTKSVCVHIRRGDFLKVKYSVLNHHYYCEAANLILKEEKDCHFFMFSDDDQWVEKTLMNKTPFVNRCTQVKHNKLCYHDFELLKSCQHHIIANSTFSWWSAWLSPNKNKIVISPRYWNKKYKIAPSSWITLENEIKENI